MNYNYILNTITRLSKKINEIYIKVTNVLNNLYNMEYDPETKTLKITDN